MLKQRVTKMNVEIKGAMNGEHMQEVMATIFANYLYSCPRHEAR